MTFGAFIFILLLNMRSSLPKLCKIKFEVCTHLLQKRAIRQLTACNVRLLAYFFQVAGWNKINIGNNSKRPANILKINTIFENGL